MKVTNRIMVNYTKIAPELASKELPIRASYAIAKNTMKIETELKAYNTERQKLVEKYALKDDDGKVITTDKNLITIPNDVLLGWNTDVNALDEIEAEVSIHTFKLEILEGIKMTPLELMNIDFMIVEK